MPESDARRWVSSCAARGAQGPSRRLTECNYQHSLSVSDLVPDFLGSIGSVFWRLLLLVCKSWLVEEKQEALFSARLIVLFRDTTLSCMI